MTAPPAIGFAYRPSRALRIATTGVAGLALWAVYLSGLDAGLRVALALLVSGVAVAAVLRLRAPRVRALLWQADGSVRVTVAAPGSAEQMEVPAVLSHARVLGLLLVLGLRWPPRGRASLWLLPDNLDAETRRLLRMRIGGHRLRAAGNEGRA